MIPYHDITEKADQSWTFRLMDRLVDPDLADDELDLLVRALEAASDPRSFSVLESIVTDTNRPPCLRKAAGKILRDMDHAALDVPAEKLRRWWREGDAELRPHALLSMKGARCPNIVEQVAAETTHSLQAAAIWRMSFWFDLPRYEAIKIAGLPHPDWQIRAAAAEVLLWDEPVAAEESLLTATYDMVGEVVAEAANTLEYYPTLQVIRRLHQLLRHTEAKVREEADDSFQSIRNRLLNVLCGKELRVAEHIRQWLRPVWKMLAFSNEELLPDVDACVTAFPKEDQKAMPVSDLLAMLGNPDESPLVLSNCLIANEWRAYIEDECRRLRPVLLTHP